MSFCSERDKADPSATWIICVQEINRNDSDTWYYEGDERDRNQVEMLQYKLNLFTGVYWYKNSNTQPNNKNEEAVAIFSTSELVKVQRWYLPPTGSRVAVAVKVALEDSAYVWAVTAHLIKPESDVNGAYRVQSALDMYSNISTFDSTVPVIVT